MRWWVLWVAVLAACSTTVQEILPFVPIRGVATDPEGTPKRNLTWRILTPPLECRRHPYIPVGRLHAKGSVSIGTVVDGYVANPVALPLEGPYHHVMDVQATRNTNWGTEELVDLVLYTARRVARKFPGSRLQVGNLGACGGGEIPWSVSHRSGRDVDLAFYLVDSQEWPVELNDMVSIDREGKGYLEDGREVYFDPARNWEMIKALLEHPGTSLQWVFIASHLKHRLLEYAREHNEPKDLIKKAYQVMWQPWSSSAHADHIHVRIYCSRDDLLDGCRDIGTNRPWYVEDPQHLEKRVKDLQRVILEKKGKEVLQAIEILGAIHTLDSHKVLLRLLSSSSPLRSQAAFSLFRWGIVRGLSERVLRLLEKEQDPKVAFHLLYAWRKGRLHSLRALRTLLLNNREWTLVKGDLKWHFSTKDFALEVIREKRILRAVPLLIECVRRSKSSKCLKALQFLCNRSLTDPDAWEYWWNHFEGKDGLPMVISGFAIKGVVSFESANKLSLTPEELKRLVILIRDQKQDWENALYLLSRLYKIWVRPPRYSLHSSRYFLLQRLLEKSPQGPCNEEICRFLEEVFTP